MSYISIKNHEIKCVLYYTDGCIHVQQKCVISINIHTYKVHCIEVDL